MEHVSDRTKKLLTLCIIHQDSRVLLGLKKRGFGTGKWNGFGGKVDPGETIEDAARREIAEEAGITVGVLEKFGILEFEYHGMPDILEVHMFRADEFFGEIAESEEMQPQWFHIDHLPFEAMWPNDPFWYPLFLNRKKFSGRFAFDASLSIRDYALTEVAGH